MSAVIGHGGTVDPAGHDHAMEHEHHGAPHGWKRWVYATNHKDIGTMYLVFSFTMFMFGGMLALGIRSELAQPGLQFFNPQLFNQLTTMHGLIMVFGAIMPAFVGFANWMVPLMIGAPDMAFARMNNLSFWLLIPAALMLAGSFFMPGGAPAAGWTIYAPLTLQMGPSMDAAIFALHILGASSIMGSINIIVTILNMRAPGMTLMKMPLFAWTWLITAYLLIAVMPVLAGAVTMLLTDHFFGTSFFNAAGGGDPVMFQHIFWFFGHPEVYILILPAWGVVTDLLAFFARKPAFGYRVTVGALIAIVVLSSVVYGHHMFTTGMSPLLGESFMVLTMIISVPTALLFLNWLGTLWRGAMRLTTPMLFCVGLVFTFGIGGLTGLFLADIVADMYLHDTYFVVGHFHLIMAAALLLSSFAAVYFWFPKMFGRMMSEGLGKLHFWPTFVSLNVVFIGQLLLGYAGMQRRLYDPSVYDFLRPLLPLNRFISDTAYLLGAAQLVFVVNFFWSLFRGKPAEPNPWQVGTLEWTVPSPPPHHNFDRLPTVVRGPHELGSPEARARGKDWLAQDEIVEIVESAEESR